MLDGPPPDVPPPESVKPHDLRDLQLAHFDRIVTELLSHVTKPLADTEGTKHSDADLERLADFIATVRDRRAAQSAAAEAKANPVFAVFAKKVADQIHRVIVSHLTSKLTEVEKALALITEPEDRAALRRIDFALEQLSVGAATWRSRLTPKEPGAVPLKLLKRTLSDDRQQQAQSPQQQDRAPCDDQAVCRRARARQGAAGRRQASEQADRDPGQENMKT